MKKLGFPMDYYMTHTKGDFDFTLYYRPVISWRLECELLNLNKSVEFVFNHSLNKIR